MQEICQKMNADVFEQEMQKSTTYGPCEGSSCLWRSIGRIVVKLLKEDGKVLPSVGLRSVWRTVVAMTHRRSHDGPSFLFVVNIRELVPVPKF